MHRVLEARWSGSRDGSLPRKRGIAGPHVWGAAHDVGSQTHKLDLFHLKRGIKN